MKKHILFLLVALLLPFVVGAQAHLVPAKVDLSENQRIMGHYDSDAIGTTGASIARTSGNVSIGVILDSEELDVFSGGKITAFRVGLAESTLVTKVFVIPVSSGGAYGSMTSWTCNVSEAGWNLVDLDTPYQLDVPEGGSLMIGFEYEQTADVNPLAFVKEGDLYDSYYYKRTGHMYMWASTGLSMLGNLCLQCIVEKDHFPEILIKTGNLKSIDFVKKGEELPFSFTVTNRGAIDIDAQALSFDVKVDDEKVATITNDEIMAVGTVTAFEGALNTEDLTSGEHTLTIANAVVGDEILSYVHPMSVSFVAHGGSYPRQKHLVEQFTSTYCTYCPLGNSMLSLVQDQRDDVIWVGVHGDLNGGKDPYTTAQGDTIMSYVGMTGYPAASFDRATGWESDMQVANSIGYYEQYHQQIADELCLFFDNISQSNPTFATIEINPVVDLETREAHITVSGEMSPDFESLLGDDNRLTVYLTEDSLVARQVNNGVWIEKYRHNGVFRCALATVDGVEFNKTENGYSNEFTVTIPQEWNMANMNVVAFISRPIAKHDYTDMFLNNAEMVPLINQEGGIEEILNDEDAVPVEYYDVMGRLMDGPRQGVNIVKMSNGSTKKVLLK